MGLGRGKFVVLQKRQGEGEQSGLIGLGAHFSLQYVKKSKKQREIQDEQLTSFGGAWPLIIFTC